MLEEALKEEYDGAYEIRYVDVDANQDLVDTYNVGGIPVVAVSYTHLRQLHRSAMLRNWNRYRESWGRIRAGPYFYSATVRSSFRLL